MTLPALTFADGGLTIQCDDAKVVITPQDDGTYIVTQYDDVFQDGIIMGGLGE